MSKSFMFRRERAAEMGGHTRIACFVGPDREHRALSGVLVMQNDEAATFWGSLNLLQYHLRELALRREPTVFARWQDLWESTDRQIEMVSD